MLILDIQRSRVGITEKTRGELVHGTVGQIKEDLKGCWAGEISWRAGSDLRAIGCWPLG